MMRQAFFTRTVVASVVVCSAAVSMGACRPSDILDVPPPSGEFTSNAIQGPTAALQAFDGAKSLMFNWLANSEYSDGSLFALTGLLGDELTYAEPVTDPQSAAVDARFTAATAGSTQESGDNAISYLLSARSSLLLARTDLQQYAAATYPATIGEAYALVGYIELLAAEGYCAGVPLSVAVVNGGWSNGTSLTTDSLLGTAQAHFDSALAHASQNDTVAALAGIGLGRTLLDRGQLAAAATAVSNVPTGFVYNTQLEPPDSLLPENYNYMNIWGYATYECSPVNISDREGGNGLNFVSAVDPRLVTDSTVAETCDGVYRGEADSVLYYPLKFGNPSTGLIPLATGIEARLIQAEAALAANPGDTTWLHDLNLLRSSGCPDTVQAHCSYGDGQVPAQPSGLLPLIDPGTDAARVSLLFRERAFWLFGTGTRLGDMRRLVRQYAQAGFTANTVFPTGPYGGTDTGVRDYFPSYGSDVALTLPTISSGNGATTNPSYKGCLASGPTTQA